MIGRNRAAFYLAGLAFLFGLASCGSCNVGSNYPAAVTPVISNITADGTTLTGPSSTTCSGWPFPNATPSTQYTITFSNLPNPSDLEVGVDGHEIPKIPLSSPLSGVQGFHFDFSNPATATVSPMDATAFVIRFRNKSLNPNLTGTQRISAPVVVNVHTSAGSTIGGRVRCELYDGRDIPGGRIAFVSDRTGQRDVWIMNGDPSWTGGVSLTQLSKTPPGFVSENPVIGPPQTFSSAVLNTVLEYKSNARVVYESSRTGGGDIYIAPVGGGTEGSLVTLPGADTEPFVGRSTDDVVWIHLGNIWGYITPPGANPAATQLQQLTTIFTQASPLASPIFNPAGDMIVFARGGKLRRIVNLAPPFTDTPLTNPAIFNIEKSQVFSPDGSKVAYIKNHTLWVVSSTGGTETQLGDPNAGLDDHPSFTVDGNYIVFDSGPPAGPRQIFRVPSAGGQAPAQLTTQGTNFSPVASPCCSSLIAFVSTRDGNREIYVMDVNGGSQTNITNNPANDDDPYWR